MTEATYASEVIFTKDTPRLCPTDQLWGVFYEDLSKTLHWGHNDYDGVSHHLPHSCLLNRLFKENIKAARHWPLNSLGPVNSPHKGLITRKKFPFDDVIMIWPRYNGTALYNLRQPIGFINVSVITADSACSSCSEYSVKKVACQLMR